MQIKHATARGLGYQGRCRPACSIPGRTCATASPTSPAPTAPRRATSTQAYDYYNGATTTPPSASASTTRRRGRRYRRRRDPATAFGSLFGATGRRPQRDGRQHRARLRADPRRRSGVPTEVVEVPLPPRRPASRSGRRPVEVAALATGRPAPRLRRPSPPSRRRPGRDRRGAQAEAAFTETVEVPLPPRRPSPRPARRGRAADRREEGAGRRHRRSRPRPCRAAQ